MSEPIIKSISFKGMVAYYFEGDHIKLYFESVSNWLSPQLFKKKKKKCF